MKLSKFSLLAGAAAVAGTTLGLGSTANAASVSQVIHNLANTYGYNGVATNYVLHDNSIDSITDTTDNNTNVISSGDTIQGTFDIGSIYAGVPSHQTLIGAGSNGVNDALFGRFSLIVDNVNTTNGTISFKADSSFAGNGSTGKTLFEFYTASQDNVVTGNNSTTSNDGFNDAQFNLSSSKATSTGTALWGTAGLAAGDNYTFSIDPSAPPTISGLQNYNNNIASLLTTAGLHWLSTPGFSPFAGQAIKPAAYILGDSSGPLVADSANFATNATVVPTPASDVATLGLLGVLGLGYVIRRRQATA